MLTCGCENCVGVCPEAGGDEHGVDGEWEHDVGGRQGDDEHIRGHKLPPPEHQDQDHQQVEDAAHQHWIVYVMVRILESSGKVLDRLGLFC